MRIFLFFFCVFFISCQTQKVKKLQRTKTEETEVQLVKVDASNLQVDLKVEEYKKADLAGVLLVPKLDPQASYISYKICNKESKDLTCIEGKIDGLLPDVVYDAPNGNNTIKYQACVIPAKAISQACGKQKTLEFTHTLKNAPPVSLALVAQNQDIRSQSLLIKTTLEEYLSKTKVLSQAEDGFDILVKNLFSIDSYVLARMLGSKSFESHVQAVTSVKKKRTSRGIATLSLGSSAIASEVFKKWKAEHKIDETSEYVEAVERSLTNLKSLDLEMDETAYSISNLIWNAASNLSMDSDSSRKLLLSKLGKIETEIILSQKDK